jgi:hypothetical protein
VVPKQVREGWQPLFGGVSLAYTIDPMRAFLAVERLQAVK